MPVVAHGSGFDELIAFLAVPALWGGFVLVRGIVRRIRGIGHPPSVSGEVPVAEEGGEDGSFSRS